MILLVPNYLDCSFKSQLVLYGKGCICVPSFRDPIHGMIDLSAAEIKIVQSDAFQRLRYIRQLGTTYLVYHGAEHTRFGHSLGVMHLVGRSLDSLRSRGQLNELSKEDFDRIKQIGRLAALLHDIGHGPFSHVGEESKIYPTLTDVDGEDKKGHEVYSHLIVHDLYKDIIDNSFEDIRVGDVLALLTGRMSDRKLHFLRDLVSGQIDADRMDYLLRDSYYCGVQYGRYDLHRLMDTLCICKDERSGIWQLGIESDGVQAVEEFVFARYWMFIQVYFHKTRRIYDHYLTQYLDSTIASYPRGISEYLKVNDNTLLKRINDSGETGQKWAKNLYNRNHIKEAFVSPPCQDNENEFDKIAFVIEEFKKKYDTGSNPDDFKVDQAKTSSAKSLLEINKYIGESDDEENTRLLAIPVFDKHTKKICPVQDYSLPIRHLSDKKINILRVYADDRFLSEVRDFCYNLYNTEYLEYANKRKEAEKDVREAKEKLKEAESLVNQFNADSAHRKEIYS